MSDAPHVEIPMDRLSEAALEAVIDDFVLREGTDYGHANIPLETKRLQVMAQLRAGTAAIEFDLASETCTIVRRER